MEFDTNQAM